MKKNIIIFNYPDGGFLGTNKDGYYSICLEDLKGHDEIMVVNYQLDWTNKIERFVYCTIKKILGAFRIKGGYVEKVWYSRYINEKEIDERRPCFVFLQYPKRAYFEYLKKRFPHAIMVKALRDLSTTQKGFQKWRNANVFDYWMSYDENESKKYGMIHFSEFESKVNLNPSTGVEPSDVFFAGRAKDRLERLIEAYDYLTSMGQKCLFLIMGVKKEEQIRRDGIRYLKKPITYRRMLEYNEKSKFLLEINQSGAVGYTSRFLEAVIYNRKLMTDNMSIKESKFYNPEYICCFENIRDVDGAFLESDKAQYYYDNEFSPIHFIEVIKAQILNNDSARVN